MLLGRVYLLAADYHARHRCHLHICLRYWRLPIFPLRGVSLFLDRFTGGFHRCLSLVLDRGLDALLPHMKVDIVEQRGLMLTIENMVGLVRWPLNRTRDAKVELAHSGLLCGLLLAGLGFLRSHHLMSDESRQGRHALGLEHGVAALLLDLCDQVLDYGLVSIRL